MRRQVGVDRIMWGSDFPHREAAGPSATSTCASRSQASTATRWRRWWAATRPTSTGSTSTHWRRWRRASGRGSTRWPSRWHPATSRPKRCAARPSPPRRRARVASPAHPAHPSRQEEGHATHPLWGPHAGAAREPGGQGHVGGGVVDVAHRRLRDRPGRGRRRCRRRWSRPASRWCGCRWRGSTWARAPAVRRRHLRRAGAPRRAGGQLSPGHAHDHRAIGHRRARDLGEPKKLAEVTLDRDGDRVRPRRPPRHHVHRGGGHGGRGPAGARRPAPDRLLLQVPARPTARASTASPLSSTATAPSPPGRWPVSTGR